MNQKQITETLAQKYREEYTSYAAAERLAREALDEGDDEGHKAIARRAQSTSHVLYGMVLAAEALGINEKDFMSAVNADQEGGEVTDDD